mmetsp:Transcript_27723/g.46601  ORF Transcript_27723/g.46601 Transcript_27723/m.46601 type:complete len:375 (-) Transcript_27723:99-1223(-)
MLSLCILVALATGTVYTGSVISTGNSLLSEDPDEQESVDMTMSQAFILPVSSSVCLLLLFFFFSYLQYALILLIIVGSISALYNLVYLCIRYSCSQVHGNMAIALSTALTLVALIDWIITGDVIVHNLLGCSLCIVFISTLRFPSLKLAVICLSLLVLYDIFWVFCSEFIFRKNVMVEVATKVAANPIYDMGEQLHVEVLKSVKPTMELPMKLMVPNFTSGRMMMLGLGDIALPGALVSLALRCDHAIHYQNVNWERVVSSDPEAGAKGGGNNDGIISNTLTVPAQTFTISAAGDPNNTSDLSSTGNSKLFQFAMWGYFIGLVAAFVGNHVSGHAQPALIYLVPAVLAAIVSRAWQIGHLQDAWIGPLKIQQSS